MAMSGQLKVEQVAEAIERMTDEERQELLTRVAKLEEFWQDLEDVADVLRSADEESRPYEKFADELRKEGLL